MLIEFEFFEGIFFIVEEDPILFRIQHKPPLIFSKEREGKAVYFDTRFNFLFIPRRKYWVDGWVTKTPGRDYEFLIPKRYIFQRPKRN